MLIVSVHCSDPVERESNDKNFFAGGANRVFTSCSETRYKLDLYLAFAPTGLSKILSKENQMSTEKALTSRTLVHDSTHG